MSELPRTKVVVLKGVGEYSEDHTKLSHYHSYAPMWAPTRGKVGGAGPDDGVA
jgi:hypothetical protein